MLGFLFRASTTGQARSESILRGIFALESESPLLFTPEMQYIGQHLKLVAFLAQSGVGVPRTAAKRDIVPTPRPREMKTHHFRAHVPRDPINARRRDYRSVSSRRENTKFWPDDRWGEPAVGSTLTASCRVTSCLKTPGPRGIAALALARSSGRSVSPLSLGAVARSVFLGGNSRPLSLWLGKRPGW